MLCEAVVELDLSPISHLIKRGQQIILKRQELAIRPIQPRIIHIPERNNLLNQQIHYINLIIGRCLKLTNKSGRWVQVILVDLGV